MIWITFLISKNSFSYEGSARVRVFIPSLTVGWGYWLYLVIQNWIHVMNTLETLTSRTCAKFKCQSYYLSYSIYIPVSVLSPLKVIALLSGASCPIQSLDFYRASRCHHLVYPWNSRLPHAWPFLKSEILFCLLIWYVSW